MEIGDQIITDVAQFRCVLKYDLILINFKISIILIIVEVESAVHAF